MMLVSGRQERCIQKSGKLYLMHSFIVKSLSMRVSFSNAFSRFIFSLALHNFNIHLLHQPKSPYLNAIGYYEEMYQPNAVYPNYWETYSSIS